MSDPVQPIGFVKSQPLTSTTITGPTALVDDPVYLVDDPNVLVGTQTTPGPDIRAKVASSSPTIVIRPSR